MVLKHVLKLTGPLALAAVFAMGVSSGALADENDPPTRAARLGFAEGSVSFEPAGTEEWVSVVLNRPLTTGDRVWSAEDGRVEMQLDGSTLRLSNNTALAFLNLGDRVTQLQLSSGSLLLRVRRLDGDETYEVDTPNLAFSILRPGLYRLSVDETGGTTAIRVRNGAGEATGGGAVYPVGANEYDVFSGTDQLAENVQEGPPEDPFDAWGARRDSRWERSASARYVSPDVVGYEDLDDHGDWRAAPGYGNVWFPRSPGAEWAPYHSGHWAYIEPWGYTWVDDQPWGFAPFHYGRWVSVNGAWGWVPAPPRVAGVVYARPVYAPALVAWVGAGAAVAWFALGPREVYVPSYPVSRAYVNNVNVSNTTVNTTVVNNVYNTVVVNKTVNVTNNVTYVNQRVPGAVAATTTQAFSTGQPVARNAVRVEARTLASAPVRVSTPPIVPAKQAVLGTGRIAAAKPPAAIQTRVVVAKVAPPPAPPAFEKRQEAIKQNGGKPLSVAELQRIQPPAAQRAAAVKIAPPAKPGSAQKTVGPVAKPPVTAGKPQTPTTESNKGAGQGAKPTTPAAQAERPAATTTPATPAKAPPPAKPDEAAAARGPASASKTQAPPPVPARTEAKKPAPSAGPPERAAEPIKPAGPAAAPPRHAAPPVQKPPAPSSAQLEQKHAQEQAQLRAKQEQERQRVQQQQQVERQQADEAKKQQLEKQHQQQTQQLQQKHDQEQQLLQQKQQQEKQQAAKKTPTKKEAP